MKTIRENKRTKVILNKDGHYDIMSAETGEELSWVEFQKGPIQENGVNGCQIEDLLAICIHRLEGLRDGPHACVQYDNALHSTKSALISLEAIK